MLAYRLEKGARCEMCGTAEWEWDPKLGGKKFAYEPVAHTCPGCAVKEASQEGNERRPGVSVVLRPTGTVDWARSMLMRMRRERKRAERKQRGLEES